MMGTPTTPEGLRRHDHLNPAEAVVRSWTDPGRNPLYHGQMVARVRECMPLLARALDRLVDQAMPRKGALEARCTLCGETFAPESPTDLVHVERESGQECGGSGELVR